MKKALVFGLALVLAGGVAYANFCARDIVPAATLLVPYVTVEMDALSGAPNPNGQTTILGVTNVSRDAVIIHVTVWDILTNPRIDFDEILSGYDVWQINFRDLLNGRFDLFDTSKTDFTASSPLTRDPFEWGPDGRAQSAGLTTPANRSAISATQCPNVPPYGNRSDLAATIRGLLNTPLHAYSHAGCGGNGAADLRADQQSWPGTVTNNPYFFYVTIDVVTRCNLDFPSTAAYWTGTTPTAANTNVLIGDVTYLKPPVVAGGVGYSEMFPAVHIEAAVDDGPRVFGFYERHFTTTYVTNPTPETFREPLATAFAFRYGNSQADGISTNLIFWKNFSELTAGGAVNDCGAYLYYAWDMDERSLSRSVEPISGLPTGGRDRNQLPFETQKVPLTRSYFDLAGDYGWMLLVLPPSYGFAPADNPNESILRYMGWAGIQFVYGTYSAGVEAATMANYHCFRDQVLPALGANSGLIGIHLVDGV